MEVRFGEGRWMNNKRILKGVWVVRLVISFVEEY